ncbi:hypothetical protein BT96DRAFT_972557 [Gymnopus androsaceus JB14]|uniref:Uncharacterized protein n=1 Tax=Gymnopus androsaceus JB14 TaxID=1447944 RepID=A0A6A4I4J8_9AGAR|nr:hypothetical protein BT96DRAFT_972557 [Gymnopus androsaceus JB14]
MVKLVSVIMLATIQIGSFFGGAAVANPLAAETLERRDISSFFATQVTLQNAAIVFSKDSYSGAFPPNITELEGIAAHIKSCSDGFDAAIIQLASITPVTGTSLLSASDAATLNTTYVPSTQQAILRNLDTLQAGEAFFEGVNNNHFLFTMFCHWVGGLSRENNIFLGNLIEAAPSADYSDYWQELLATAASQYQIWLTEDGFNCGGLIDGLLGALNNVDGFGFASGYSQFRDCGQSESRYEMGFMPGCVVGTIAEDSSSLLIRIRRLFYPPISSSNGKSHSRQNLFSIIYMNTGTRPNDTAFPRPNYTAFPSQVSTS